MQQLGTVLELWHYPVKSMAGERRQEVQVEERGAVGDRVYALRDDQGRLGSGKNTRRFAQLDGLLEYQASLVNGSVQVRCPGGQDFDVDDPALPRLLSSRFGRPVAVTPEHATAHMDAAPLHLVTTAALGWLEGRGVQGLADVRRFRPNMVLAIDDSGLVEHHWPGYRLRIGESAELLVVDTTERCRMITLPQGELPAAPGLLRRISQDAGLQFGVYADVMIPGVIRAGDAVYRIS